MRFVLIRPNTIIGVLPFEQAPNSSMPFGSLYLMEALERNGIPVTFIDDAYPEAMAPVFDAIDNSVTAIGISTMSGTQLRNAIGIARQIRQKHPELPLVWGGRPSDPSPGSDHSRPAGGHLCRGRSRRQDCPFGQPYRQGGP